MHVQAMGMSVVSIQWGAWANAGMATQSSTTQARFERMGVGFITPQQGLSALSSVIHQHPMTAISATAAAVMDWSKYLKGRSNPLPAFFNEVGGLIAADPSAGPAVGATHSAHAGGAFAADLLVTAVSDAVQRVMGTKVGADAPLMAAGIDSLGAVELRDTLQEALGVQLTSTLLFDYPTVSAIAKHAALLLSARPTQTSSGSAPTHQEPAGLQTTGPAAPAVQEIEGRLLSIVRQVMGMEVGAAEPLMAAGLDSLGAIELRDSIQESFGIQLAPTLAMDFPSVSAICAHLITHMPQVPISRGAVLIAHPTEHHSITRSLGHVAQMQPTAVAIVGMSAQSPSPHPAAEDSNVAMNKTIPFSFGCDAVSGIPHSRWDVELQGRMAGLIPSRFASLLGHVDEFDMDAFSIPHVEAALMDPQQRLLLQAATDAMAHTEVGGFGTHWRSRCGVFVGASWMDYGTLIRAHQGVTPYSGTGTASSALSGRLAYSFGLQGPTTSGESSSSILLLAVRPLGSGSISCGAVPFHNDLTCLRVLRIHKSKWCLAYQTFRSHHMVNAHSCQPCQAFPMHQLECVPCTGSSIKPSWYST